MALNLDHLETISEPHFRWYGRLARTLHYGITIALRDVCTGSDARATGYEIVS